jgi:hypothetical protein
MHAKVVNAGKKTNKHNNRKNSSNKTKDKA